MGERASQWPECVTGSAASGGTNWRFSLCLGTLLEKVLAPRVRELGGHDPCLMHVCRHWAGLRGTGPLLVAHIERRGPPAVAQSGRIAEESQGT